MPDHEPAIVIDNGSGFMKAGFACEKTPKSYFPALISQSISPGLHPATTGYYVGEAVVKDPRISEHIRPIAKGLVQDWDVLEHIWEHAMFEELQIEDGSNRPMLFAAPPSSDAAQHARIAGHFFEVFNSPSVGFVEEAELALLASGRTTGVVLESGDDQTYAVVVRDGCVVEKSRCYGAVAGRDVTNKLRSMIHEHNHFSPHDYYTREIKEANCFVSLDPEAERGYGKIVTPPHSGRDIPLSKERFMAPELLFSSNGGVAKLIIDAVAKDDAKFRDELYENIVLSGGNTMFPGFAERLQKELASSSSKVKIDAQQERKHLVWSGLSKFAASPAFQKKKMMMVTNAQWYELSGEEREPEKLGAKALKAFEK